MFAYLCAVWNTSVRQAAHDVVSEIDAALDSICQNECPLTRSIIDIAAVRQAWAIAILRLECIIPCCPDVAGVASPMRQAEAADRPERRHRWRLSHCAVSTRSAL